MKETGSESAAPPSPHQRVRILITPWGTAQVSGPVQLSGPFGAVLVGEP